MPEAWLEGLLLAAALLGSVLGMACFALAMETHWQQVRGDDSVPGRAGRVLAALGALALAASLLLCLAADHASMAALVWAMTLTAGALLVAFTLAWRPRLLAPLAGCVARAPIR